jgi:hypothetical protein
MITSPRPERAKKLAKLLRDDLAAAGFAIPHSLALELIAHQLGTKDWNVLVASVGRGRSEPAAPAAINPAVPVLRVMSVEVALPFYVDNCRCRRIASLASSPAGAPGLVNRVR